MLTRIPLWAQLSVAMFVVIILLLILNFMANTQFIERASLDFYAAEEQRILSDISAAAVLEERGTSTLLRDFSDARFNAPNSGFYWTIWRDGSASVSSKSLLGRALPALPASSEGIMVEVSTPLGRVLQTQKSYPALGRIPAKRVAVAISVDSLEKLAGDINATRRQVNFPFAIFLIVTLATVLWVLSRPLRRFSLEITHVQSGVKEKINGSYPRDVQSLAKKFDDILQNQRHTFDQSLLVLASFNHNLRSSLAKILYQLEGPSEDAEGLKSKEILKQIISIERQIVTYTNSLRSRRFQYLLLKPLVMEVEKELETVFDAAQRVHRHRGLDWYLGVGPTVHIQSDPDSFREIVFHLLDNAGKWADQKVSCKWDFKSGEVSVIVEDDGPGLTHASKAVADPQGMGIGLQIADELAAILGGTIRNGRSRFGGALFCLNIPIPSSEISAPKTP